MSLQLTGWRFPVLLALLLGALLAAFPPSYNGDAAEYSLDTIALATHGTPEIRLADLERAKALLPQLADPYGQLERGMRAGDDKLYAAFVRGREGKVYSVHFFGYPALAALPFWLLDRVGAAPFKAFQVVNLAAVFVLGLALWRFFRSGAKALAGVGLFLLCGGSLYLNWTSPECVSAAALLAGLLLFASGAPLAGSLLAGLAAQQNPTIVFFFGFAPLMLLALTYRPGAGLPDSLAALLDRRTVTGLGAGLLVAALPPLFNLYQFGTPNIIARLFSDPGLISLLRLESFFFDLNQGMIIAVPGVLAALACWGWQARDGRRAPALVLLLCAGFTLALALPALAVLNWNSGAAGVMRYAFWAAMPFLFALLLRLQSRRYWPAALVAPLALVQTACMVHGVSYTYVQFSPLARLVLARAPSLYHPEPEIFAERSSHNDDYIQPSKVYAYRRNGQVLKSLVNAANPEAGALLCAGGSLAPDNRIVPSTRGWRYIDGPPRCKADVLLRAASLRQDSPAGR